MKRYLEAKRAFVYLYNSSKGQVAKRYWNKRIAFCNRKIGLQTAQRILAVIMVAILLRCSGCHTVEGVGKDLQKWASPYTERLEK